MPSDENLNYPNTSMMKIEKYANSYRAEAMKIKKRKIWINFAAGAGFIGLALLGSMAAHIG